MTSPHDARSRAASPLDCANGPTFLPPSSALPPSARELIAQIARACEAGASAAVSRSSPASQQLHLPLHAPLRAKILEIADQCAADRAAMDDYAARFPGGPAVASIIARPAFVELVRTFASSFTSLTEIVDKAAAIECPWRDLVASQPILAGLDAGFDAERQLILARALASFRKVASESREQV